MPPFLQQLGHAQNAGQGIVEFVSEAADHLSHRRQTFGLDDLALEFLLGGHVAHGNNHARGFALGIEERARHAEHGAGVAILMLDGVLAGSAQIFSGRDRLIKLGELGPTVVGVLHAFAEELFRTVAEQLANARAHEGVLALQIEDENEVREALQQMAAEFLLSAQLALHGAFLGDVDQRSLVAHELAVLDHAAGDVLAHGDTAVFSLEFDFARAGAAALASRAPQNRFRTGVDLERFRRHAQQLFLARIAQDGHQRGIHLQQLAYGRTDVDAFRRLSNSCVKRCSLSRCSVMLRASTLAPVTSSPLTMALTTQS